MSKRDPGAPHGERAAHLSETPRVDALEKLLGIFTVEQLDEIAEMCRNLAEITDGRKQGDLVIGFSRGHPRFINGYLRQSMTYKPAPLSQATSPKIPAKADGVFRGKPMEND